MRKFTILFQLVILFFGYNSLFGQNSVPIVDEQFNNTPLTEVLSILNNKYNLQLAYDNASIQDVVINQSLNKLELEDALQKIFSDTDFKYWLTDEQQLLIQKVENFTFTPSPKQAKYIEVTGQIIDAQTNEALAYATIHTVPGNNYAITDEAGNFKIKVVQEKNTSVCIRYLGYETKYVPVDQSKNLKIKLSPEILTIDAVVISETPNALSSSTNKALTKYNASVLFSLPAFAGGTDVFRNLQLLPGIAAHDDLSANLKVRGGNGDENMVLLDGITLYNVNHFYGIFSNINGNLVDDVKIYKNAFPAQFGGRTSSVIDISTIKEQALKLNAGAEINLLTSSAQLGIPLSKNMNLLLGARMTNSNLGESDLFQLQEQEKNNEAQNFQDGERTAAPKFIELVPDYGFYDVNAKWTWQPDPSLSLSASYFRGADHMEYDYETKVKLRNEKLVDASFFENGDWYNQGVSIRFNKVWNSKFKTAINLSNSNYQIENSSNLTINAPNRTTTRFDQSRTNKIKGTELNIKNTWRISDVSNLNFGYHLIHNKVKFLAKAKSDTRINHNESGKQNVLFAEYQLNSLDDKFNLTLGLRATNYDITNSYYFSPRVFASYQVEDQFLIKASLSRYNQFLRQSYHEDFLGRSYEFWALATNKANIKKQEKNYPIAASNHLMLGFSIINDWFSLDVEAYQKNTTGIFEQALSLIGFEPGTANGPNEERFYKVLKGKGQTRGIDFLLKKDNKNYTGWLAYTLSKSTQTYKGINNNNPFPTQDYRPHQLSLVNIFKYKNWEFSGTYVFASGKPYTDLSTLINGLRDRDEIPRSELLKKLEDYHRADLGVNYQFEMGKAKAKIGLSVFNLFDHSNVKYRQFIFSAQETLDSQIHTRVIGTEVQMLGRTPNVSFSINF